MIASHKGHIPFLILLLPLMAGITCALIFPQVDGNPLLYGGILLSLLFTALNVFHNKLKVYRYNWIGALLIIPILFIAGWYLTIQHNELRDQNHFSKQRASSLVVNIASEPLVKNDIVRFTADVVSTVRGKEHSITSGTMLISIKNELAKNLFYGEQLLVPANYTTVEPPYNPGEFNYKQYLANKNIYHQAYLYPKQYYIIDAGKGNPIISKALDIRQRLVHKLTVNMHDTTAIAVASTLILGYRADLSNDIVQAYSKTGTIHILSVSGGHVAILYALLVYVFGFLHKPREKILRAVIIVTAIWAYALLTGFSPAVCRAALMITFVIAGKTYSRHVSNLNILAVSAFVLLLYNPYLLTDVGFQLSYIAVAGLVIFQPIIYKWFSFKNSFAEKLWLACSVSVAAQVATFPLSVYYFHKFPVYFLISNLLIIFPVAVIMYAGLVVLLLPQMPVVSSAIGYVLEKSIILMNKMLNIIELAPYASIGKIWITKVELAVLMVIIMLLLYFLHNRSNRVLLASLVCLLILCCSLSLKRMAAERTDLTAFLNLRKHQGIIFKHGSNGVVLTDLSESDKTFQYAIQPGLDSMRITQYKVIPLDKDFRNTFLLKKDGLIWFLNKRFLFLNDNANFKSIPNNMNLNSVYISNNIALDSSLRHMPLIIDGSNSQQYVDLLNDKGKKYTSLKRNKALVLLSN